MPGWIDTLMYRMEALQIEVDALTGTRLAYRDKLWDAALYLAEQPRDKLMRDLQENKQ